MMRARRLAMVALAVVAVLAFGIVAGAELAGLPSETVIEDEVAGPLGWWAPWLGVLVFGFAVALYFSARYVG